VQEVGNIHDHSRRTLVTSIPTRNWRRKYPTACPQPKYAIGARCSNQKVLGGPTSSPNDDFRSCRSSAGRKIIIGFADHRGCAEGITRRCSNLKKSVYEQKT